MAVVAQSGGASLRHMSIVVIVIVGVDVVSDIGDGMYRIGNLTFTPGPELSGVGFVLRRDLCVDFCQWLAIFPCAWFIAERVVDRVDHTSDFVHVSHEQVIAILIAVVLDHRLRQRERRGVTFIAHIKCSSQKC